MLYIISALHTASRGKAAGIKHTLLICSRSRAGSRRRCWNSSSWPLWRLREHLPPHCNCLQVILLHMPLQVRSVYCAQVTHAAAMQWHHTYNT